MQAKFLFYSKWMTYTQCDSLQSPKWRITWCSQICMRPTLGPGGGKFDHSSELRVLFWFTKLGLVCSPGLAVSKNFKQFSESIDTEQIHCCWRYITWINVANQITIWEFLLMTYNWLVIAVRFMIQGLEKETFKWYLGWSPWILQAKIHLPQHM